MRVNARLGRAIAAGVLCATAVFGVAGCQFASLTEYPPANGINATSNGVMVRNIVVVETAPGEGVLLGAIVTDNDESLGSLDGVTHTPTGDDASALQFTMPASLDLPRKTVVSLADKGITVTSPDLRAGLTVTVDLTFRDAGTISVTVPVMSSESAEYKDFVKNL